MTGALAARRLDHRGIPAVLGAVQFRAAPLPGHLHRIDVTQQAPFLLTHLQFAFLWGAYRRAGGGEAGVDALAHGGHHHRARVVELVEQGAGEAASLVEVFVEDRKSTRLNSSHVKISYAV